MADLQGGGLQLLTYGMRPYWSARFAEILKKELGVRMRSIAGCLVSRELRAFADGYNTPMEAAIAERFGEGALARAEERAKRDSKTVEEQLREYLHAAEAGSAPFEQ